LTYGRYTVTVRFKAVGAAPILGRQVFKISGTQRFETVVNFLRKQLRCKPTDSVFLYVNSVFAPALDEIVGNLFRVSWLEGLSVSRATLT
jgi:ubiquitin-like protein ATG12